MEYAVHLLNTSSPALPGCCFIEGSSCARGFVPLSERLEMEVRRKWIIIL